MGEQVSGLGILMVLFAIVAWMLALAIREGCKKAARMPERQAEWHESFLADGDERMVTRPTAVMPVLAEQPRWEREIREILGRIAPLEADAGDETGRCES